MAVNHDMIRAKHIAAVIDALKSKAIKSYPNNTALVVRIDDARAFRENGVVALDNVARAALVPMLSGREFNVLPIWCCRNQETEIETVAFLFQESTFSSENITSMALGFIVMP